jgi:polyhydroxyalkanoate synthesis regulator phasin
MKKAIEKTLLAGLGLAAITKKKTEQLVSELIEKGKIARPEAEEFVKKAVIIVKGKTAEAKSTLMQEINEFAKGVEKATRPPRKTSRKAKAEKK